MIINLNTQLARRIRPTVWRGPLGHGTQCYPVLEVLSLPDLQRIYGTEGQREAVLEKARWPERSNIRAAMATIMDWSMATAQTLSVPQLRPSGLPQGRHNHVGYKTSAEHLDCFLLFDQ